MIVVILLNMETISALKIPEKKITLEEISELEEPVKNIIEQIKTRIENGEYGIIIGDDASGRIPALILGSFIKRISKLRNLREPNIIFIPGKLRVTEDTLDRKVFQKLLQKHITKYGAKKGDRVLIVTEAIDSGDSLGDISHLLKVAGFEVDIATMGIESLDNGLYKIAREENLRNSNIISGNYVYVKKGVTRESHTSLVYSQGRIMNGITKKPGDLRAKTKKSQFGVFREKAPIQGREIQEKINQSRIEVNILVDKLVVLYLAEEGRK
jgi:adenine/guanine phosphoribosyltransferase-like PRPP-binding protein